MPVVETGRLATPASPQKMFGGAAHGFADHPSAGNDFDDVMQAALAPSSQKPTGKSTMLAANSRLADKPSPADSSITAARARKSGNENSDGKLDAAKKPAAGNEGKISPDTNAPSAGVVTEPLPAFLSLPLFIAGPFSGPVNPAPPAGTQETATATTGGLDKISAATAQPTGKPEAKNSPLNGALASSTSRLAATKIFASPATPVPDGKYAQKLGVKANSTEQKALAGTAINLAASVLEDASAEPATQSPAGASLPDKLFADSKPETAKNLTTVPGPDSAAAPTTPQPGSASRPAVSLGENILSAVKFVEAAVLESVSPNLKNSDPSMTTESAKAEVLAFQKDQPAPALNSFNTSTTDLSAITGQPAATETLESGSAIHPNTVKYTPETMQNGDTDASLEQAAEKAGTGVAIMPLPMKNQQNTNKVAGPDVKVLPVGDTAPARAKNLPSELVVAPVRAAENRNANLNFAFSNGNDRQYSTENATALNVLDLPSLTDARVRALDRTHDMMALHAVRLLESKSDTLSVVIKPAAGMELSLELRQHANGIEAQAKMTRGDHQFLSQHWPDLQQRLEQRGIKLAPLGTETGFPSNDSGHFQKHQPSQEEVMQQASAFAEFASVGNTGGATARVATVHDGWESWA